MQDKTYKTVTLKEGINVLSLCDGMSCGQISLTELGIKINNYIASEIEKNAIKVTLDNFPDTKEIGNVMDFVVDSKVGNPRFEERKVGGLTAYIPTEDTPSITLNEEKLNEFPKIDLVIFGSPCRSLTKATAGRKITTMG